MRTITSYIKVYGTAAERIAMRDSDIPDNQEITFVEDDTGSVYYWDGDSWTQTHSGGAAHVHADGSLPLGIQHLREQIALSTTAVTFDFSATPIKAAKIAITSDTAHTAEMVASAAYCIDPPNSTIRDAWLTEGTNLTGDTNRFLLKVGGDEVIEFKDINGDYYGVDYIGIKLDDGAGTLRVVVVGVEL